VLQEELSIAGHAVESKSGTQNQPSADDQTLSIVENEHWFHVPSNNNNNNDNNNNNNNNTPKIVKEIYTQCMPITINRFEPLSSLTEKTDNYGTEMDKELRNCSGHFQRNAVYKDNNFLGNYKLSAEGSKSKCKNHESAENRN
jgi:hypothetical protein